jgi:hypothetical protein
MSRAAGTKTAVPRSNTPFAATGTVMERSHIALHKWVQGFHLMCSSKKGISAHQLHRLLKITYKAAWFMAHRIRESMRDGGVSGPLGGSGKIVEADETYYGNTEVPKVSPQRRGCPFTKQGKGSSKRAIVALVERGGSVRTFHVPTADKHTVSKHGIYQHCKEKHLHRYLCEYDFRYRCSLMAFIG